MKNKEIIEPIDIDEEEEKPVRKPRWKKSEPLPRFRRDESGFPIDDKPKEKK